MKELAAKTHVKLNKLEQLQCASFQYQLPPAKRRKADCWMISCYLTPGVVSRPPTSLRFISTCFSPSFYTQTVAQNACFKIRSLNRLYTSPQYFSSCRVAPSIKMDSDSMKLSCLPCWDLAQHFPWTSWNDPKITTAIEQIEQDAASFDERFRGEIKRKLEPSLLAYSDLVTKITEVLTFLKLIYDEDQSNEEMFQFKTQVEARLNK